ncbi:hypothetical protein K0M31_008967, partial [Melipona bicolor]
IPRWWTILETLGVGDFGDSRSDYDRNDRPIESGKSMTCRFEGLYRRGNCRYILEILGGSADLKSSIDLGSIENYEIV